MPSKTLSQKIEIPEKVNIDISIPTVKISGPNGNLERKFSYPGIEIKKDQNILVLETKKTSKNDKRMMNTFTAHLKNMIIGVEKDYVYKLKICSGHFPMTVTHEGNTVIIKNFLGEKVPRKAKIIEGVKVDLKKDEITLTGPNIELVGQTAANLEASTRITNKDRRKFQDGLYIIEKQGVKI